MLDSKIFQTLFALGVVSSIVCKYSFLIVHMSIVKVMQVTHVLETASPYFPYEITFPSYMLQKYDPMKRKQNLPLSSVGT